MSSKSGIGNRPYFDPRFVNIRPAVPFLRLCMKFPENFKRRATLSCDVTIENYLGFDLYFIPHY